MPRRTVLPGLVLASFLIAPSALAASSPEDAALADSLYADGGKLMEAGRFAEACPKIEASWKLDPGIGSTLRLAFCWQKIGRLASASAMYRESEALARRAGDKRADEAAKYAKDLEPLLSRLVLDVAPENQAGGVEIRRDGKVIDAAAWSSGIPIDPGPHVMEAAAPGRLPWKTTVTIEAKPGVTTLRVPVLADAPPQDMAGQDAPAFWSGRRTAGIVVGGLGMAGTLAGAIAGGLTLQNAGEAKTHCRSSGVATACDPTGISLRSTARTLGNVANVGLAVGGSAIVAGVILFVTAPGGAPTKSTRALRFQADPSFGGAGPGFSMEGTW